ncbi:MAG: hypothetical protein ACYS8W_05900 [Planctomycetota bacterium]|jgi:hypothetical protein
MRQLSILGAIILVASMLACTGCATARGKSELPPDPIAGMLTAPVALATAAPLAAPMGEKADETDTEYYEDEEESEGGDAEWEGGEFPFDRMGRIEVSFNALYRETNHHGSDSETQEILLAPEVGIVVHKFFEAIAGLGLYWLRGGEKELLLWPVPVGGTVPGHYRIEERYLEFGGRANFPLPDMNMVVPFAELKLGLATHAEWNRIMSKHDWGFSNTLAFGCRLFLSEDRKVALTGKFNLHHVEWDEDEIIYGSRAVKELIFGFSFFF